MVAFIGKLLLVAHGSHLGASRMVVVQRSVASWRVAIRGSTACIFMIVLYVGYFWAR